MLSELEFRKKTILRKYARNDKGSRLGAKKKDYLFFLPLAVKSRAEKRRAVFNLSSQ